MKSDKEIEKIKADLEKIRAAGPIEDRAAVLGPIFALKWVLEEVSLSEFAVMIGVTFLEKP